MAGDVDETVKRITIEGSTDALVRAPESLENEVVVAPREAFLGPSDVVAVDDSIGRVSAEAIAGYPPGIPVLLPGERITDDVIAYLRSLKSVGARLHGASDPDFNTICVMPAAAQ
jgi:lysine decarboxylase